MIAPRKPKTCHTQPKSIFFMTFTPSYVFLFLYFSTEKNEKQEKSNELRATRLARSRYRAAARTRAPKQSTGLFFSLCSCPVLASARTIPKKKIPILSDEDFFFGAGDEARTRYLDLGKVALYQMSYARKRKMYYISGICICQPLK